MLQNAYLLAKIGADTAENERTFAENLQLPYEDRDPRAAQGRRPDGGDGAAARAGPREARGRLRGVRQRGHALALATFFAKFCKS